MTRHTSIMRVIAHQGRNTPGVDPDTIAALKALAEVEARMGITSALQGALSAFLTTVASLGKNADAKNFDLAIGMMEQGLAMLREAQSAQAEDRAPGIGIVVTTVDVPEDTVGPTAGRA